MNDESKFPVYIHILRCGAIYICGIEKYKVEGFLLKQSRIIERDSTRIWVIIDGAEAF